MTRRFIITKYYSLHLFHSSMRKTGEILKALRRLMENLPNNLGSIQAYIVPSGDAHQSEYLADCHQRRAFVSGFDGSAGTAVITQKHALLWTDGRYWLQATQQLDENWTLMKDNFGGTLSIEDWLSSHLSDNDRVGVDANLMSTREYTPLDARLISWNKVLVPIETNLIDLIWKDQPSAPSHKVMALGLEFTGKTVAQKLTEIRKEMKEKQCSVLAVTALDEIACNYEPIKIVVLSKF